MNISSYLEFLANWIWGYPLLIFLTIANIILLSYSKFLPLRYFSKSFTILKRSGGDGVSSFEALSNALAATIGLGNISGVAVALVQGGPGALFWMWVTAFVGMNTKFFETSVAVIYKGKNYKDESAGGAMYAIEKHFKGPFKMFAYLFSVCGLIGTLSLFQINQVSEYINSNYNISKLSIGIFFAVIVFFILAKGIKGISRVTSKLVPLMSVIYILSCFVIIGTNFKVLPEVIISIFKNAFNLSSVAGGVTGYALMSIISAGVKRATFSNESGLGTAPLAHSDTNLDEPLEESIVSMLGPFWDTIVICSLTGFAILCSGVNLLSGESGILLTTKAFELSLPGYGKDILGISVLLFSFSTMIGMANYNKKCWDFVFKGKWFFNDRVYLVLYSITIVIGSVVKMKNVINLMDFMYALMALPNILITVYFAKEIMIKLKAYEQKN